MVKIVASRAAGFRLAWIFAVLLIPIVYLGSLIIGDMRKELNDIDTESRGAALLNLIVPVMLDAAAGKSDPKTTSQLLNDGSRLAQSVGVDLDFNSILLSLSMQHVDHAAVLRGTSELAQQAGENSSLVNDDQTEVRHLALAGARYLPDVISKFRKLEDLSAAVSSGQNVTDYSAEQVLLTASHLADATQRLQNEINGARKSAKQNYDYRLLAEMIGASAMDADRLTNQGLRSEQSSKDMALAMSGSVTSMSQKLVHDYRESWRIISTRMGQLVAARQDGIYNKASVILVISIGTILLGLGSAVGMFRSTLLELDKVQLAREEADAARCEAEGMSQKLSGINDEMARVNSDLAHNMDMLRDAQDALVKKGRMEQMGQLTATIAHELRNPLGAVRTSAFLIERKIKGKELGIEPQILRINNGVTRCDDIITQLLDFSRSKKLSCRSENLDRWLEKVISEEAGQLPAAVTINCILGLHDLNVPFDPSRLQRAIINLVSNASEAMVGNGEDPSRYAVSNPTITINTSIVGESVSISVRDNGPGIAPENLEKIREPLFTTKSFGTGLGLPAVDQIVMQHGGTFDITSVQGEGAVFTLNLPLRELAEEAA